VESELPPERPELVRCLDCGTVYRQPASDCEAGPCPTCGYIGWIALRVEQEPRDRDR
jgi:predicted  nucleic acid-binding Zn-ribbon protein